LKRKSANKNHILGKQTTKRKRHNRGLQNMEGATLDIAKKLLVK
jgi:ribosomal protein L35